MDEVSATQDTLARMLGRVLADGGRKRAAGLKDHWTVDPGHVPALERHLVAWGRGEFVDADSGAHPLVHVAARALMIAWQEEVAACTNPMTRGPTGAPTAPGHDLTGCCGGYTSDSTCCDGS